MGSKMRSRVFTLASLALALALPAVRVAHADDQKLTLGMFAPTVEFGTAQARLAYAQALAKSIEQATGIKTEAQSYASLAALEKDKVDFAIVDGVCVSTHTVWRVLATANVGGATSREWALFSSTGEPMQSLKGKKLAFVQTGCSDAGFVDNAMLESEVDAGFFGGRIGEKDLTGAIADVASYKTAQAVFAPTDAAKGLKKVFDASAVPNPALALVNAKLSSPVVEKAAAAVLAYGGGGAIASWSKPTLEAYRVLAARLPRVTKTPLLANPEPVRVDANNVLIDPPTARDYAVLPVRAHFIHATRIE
jgi:hypothetical protein